MMVDPLIEPQELAERLTDDRPPTLLDVRWQLGRPPADSYADYLAGHLPGAAFLDLDTALSGPVNVDRVGGRHPMPSTQTASDAFRAVGVRHDHPVVAYDGSTSLAASRAWWVLKYFGHEQVRVLNGGYAAWVAENLPAASGPVQTPAGDVELRPGHRRIATAQEVLELTERPGSQLIDARAPERYRGEVEPIDPVAGHIPGALNVATLAALDSSGRFRSQYVVEQLVTLGVDPDAPTTLYCGSGVQAMHLALTLEASQASQASQVGHRPPAIYVGSWSDWVSDPSRPTRRGDA